MADAALRLAVLFGPRRGVTREVHQRLLVGRAAEADLQLLDDKVSREHCVFEASGGALVLKDLGSRNGTWVNGARLEAPRILAANDSIGIGETVVVYAADVASSLARDGDSTLVVSAASPLTAPVLADEPLAEPAAEALNQAGRLMLQAALAPSRDEAALALARAVTAALACREVLVCTRTAEGALRPWVGLPSGLVLSINGALADFAMRQQRAVSVEEPQARAVRDAQTTWIARANASVLCAPLLGATHAEGVVFASRTTPFDAKELALVTVLARVVAPALRQSAVAPRAAAADDDPVAESPSMREAVRVARQVAPTLTTVLLCGESGTGKEELARLVHRASRRAREPFIAVNCGAIAPELAESELFGHEKGSFTGATQQHLGVFERADGGTLFLDEVGELAAAVQVKLLRVLEERVVWRVGARAPVAVDVRIVCATNRALEDEVATGRFRADLYWRLNVVRVALEPLRSRPEDLLPLATRLLARHAATLGRRAAGFSPEALRVLARAPWPGNVRQLSNALERALVLKVEDGPLTLNDLPPELLAPPPAASGASAGPRTGRSTLGELVAELEREQIALALKRARGVKARAAEALGISRPTLDRKLEEHHLDWLEGEG